jgi:hypothetical protein
MTIYCCGCGADVDAHLTNGHEIYPHRDDLASLPFWRCTGCGNYVGCHHKTPTPTRPLGAIPTPELRRARQAIHALIDPMWQSGVIPRRDLYQKISRFIGHQFHTSEILSLAEAKSITAFVLDLKTKTGCDSQEAPA